MERLENVGLWNGDWEQPQQVLVNTEWGAFGDRGDLDSVLTGAAGAGPGRCAARGPVGGHEAITDGEQSNVQAHGSPMTAGLELGR